MAYYHKYVKYKNKYLELQKTLSQDDTLPAEITDQSGEVSKYNLNILINREVTREINFRNSILPNYSLRDLNMNDIESKDKKRIEEDINVLREQINNATSDDLNSFSFWDKIKNSTIIDYFRVANSISVNFDTNSRTNRDPSKYNIYSDPNYKLFNSDFFGKVVDNLLKQYQESYSNKWFADDIPNLIEGCSNNYIPQYNYGECIFVQKISIPNSKSKIHFIGDIHSSFHSLLNLLGDIRSSFVEDTMVLKENCYIIFTGDLLDRGPYSLEVLWCALNLKHLNPTNVYICKGNHENIETYSSYGASEEISNQLESNDVKINLRNLLNFLPVAIFINFAGSIYQACHGAFEPSVAGLRSGAKFRNSPLKEFLDDTRTDKTLKYFSSLGSNNQFQWGDFNISPWLGYNNSNETKGRHRFYNKIVRDYLSHHNIESIISGHQDNHVFGMMHPNPNVKSFRVSDLITFNFDSADKLITNEYLKMYDADSINFNLKPSNKVLNISLNNISSKTKDELVDQDVIACILSSCSASKLLYYRSIATLECTEGFIENSNEFTKTVINNVLNINLGSEDSEATETSDDSDDSDNSDNEGFIDLFGMIPNSF